MTDKSQISVGRRVLRVGVLFAALFAIGLVTRMPAWQFPQVYALHGVLAAPFCGALALWHFSRGGTALQLACATGILALVLGMMSLAMGLGFAVVAVLTLAAWAMLGRAPENLRRQGTAVLFGALDYPCALGVGLALGSFRTSVEGVPLIALLLVLSAALSLFGVFAVDLIADWRRNRRLTAS